MDGYATDPAREQNAKNLAGLYGGFCACEQARYLFCLQQYELSKSPRPIRERLKNRVFRTAVALRETPLGPPLKRVWAAVKVLRRKILAIRPARKRR